jgi:2,3-bisphosphoglycerate-independent phosphoglycerate mutase
MRYFVLIPDGAAEKFERGTPLEKAKTENLDYLARKSFLGVARTIPHGLPPGSDIGTLSILGYDPYKFAKGRAPLELSAKGVDIPEKALVFRMNLVTVKDGVILDHSAGHIKDEEAKKIIEKLNLNLKDFLQSNKMKILFGKSYRNYLLWEIDDEKKLNEYEKTPHTPPHDILGQKIEKFITPIKELRELTKLCEEILKSESNSANSVWFWGQGRKIVLPQFEKIYGKKAHLVSAVDILRGIGKLAGINVIDVPGITGYLDSNFEGKVDYILDNTKDGEIGIIHVEATDETGHEGDPEKKKYAIEIFDKRVLGRLLEKTKGENIKILVMPDHPTPCEIRTHSPDPVPFLIYPCICNNGKCFFCSKQRFTELSALSNGVFFDGREVLKFFLSEKKR